MGPGSRAQVPTKTKPRDNVAVRMCTEVCNFAQPIQARPASRATDC
jgi:hypothetical protein